MGVDYSAEIMFGAPLENVQDRVSELEIELGIGDWDEDYGDAIETLVKHFSFRKDIMKGLHQRCWNSYSGEGWFIGWIIAEHSTGGRIVPLDKSKFTHPDLGVKAASFKAIFKVEPEFYLYSAVH